MKKIYIAPQTEELAIQTGNTLLAASGAYSFESYSDTYSDGTDLARSHDYGWDDEEDY